MIPEWEEGREEFSRGKGEGADEGRVEREAFPRLDMEAVRFSPPTHLPSYHPEPFWRISCVLIFKL